MITIKGKKYTQQEFDNKVKELTNDEYTVKGTYINSNTKITMHHNASNCNKDFKVKPSHFLNDGTRCPYCSKKSKKPKGIKRNKQTNYSKEIIDDIIYYYNIEHKSIRKIGQILNIDRRIVSKILKENEVIIDGNVEKHKKISDDVYINIFKEKNKNNTYKELAKKYGVEYSSIRKRKYLLKQIEYDNKKKYNLDVNYFRIIDTQEKAYILGFLMADGCVTKTNQKYKTNRLIVNISYKDISILEFIKKQFKSTAPIIEYYPLNTYANNKMCKITFNSCALCEDLQKYGIIPNKTGKEIIPKLNNNLLPHFIRGFFDGDGISYSNGTIGFCSNENFLLDLKSILIEKLNLTGKLSITEDKDKNLFYLKINTKKDVKKVKDYIYTNATFYLERKFKNF